ncbi:hypothetical protein SAMN04489859_104030 [Paracoccus alcaliphilus]|uniref:Uncharacterized protein n=1 Tax=Paracoccus alcaliphilus TaxID=34002 RepID=A0A1H8MHI6_9RHOB|nr:hypothetical protein SAMN04489859_104030 [Paracoccus alcaliphilus]
MVHSSPLRSRTGRLASMKRITGGIHAAGAGWWCMAGFLIWENIRGERGQDITGGGFDCAAPYHVVLLRLIFLFFELDALRRRNARSVFLIFCFLFSVFCSLLIIPLGNGGGGGQGPPQGARFLVLRACLAALPLFCFLSLLFVRAWCDRVTRDRRLGVTPSVSTPVAARGARYDRRPARYGAPARADPGPRCGPCRAMPSAPRPSLRAGCGGR